MRAIVTPVIDESVRELCRCPYPNHPKGCPNYGRHASCPPKAPLLGNVIHLDKPVWVIWSDFDLTEHRKRMRAKHPNWSKRQLDCCLYWQGTTDKHLRHDVANFCTEQILFRLGKRFEVLYRPEAMGVNVTATLKQAGIDLEWPPENIVRKVALVGETS